MSELATWRTRRGLKQRAAAHALGISVFSVQAIECGRRPLMPHLKARMAEVAGADAAAVIEAEAASYRARLYAQAGLAVPVANDRLQAAAPELLEACRFVLRYEGRKLGSVSAETLREAIKSAEV